MAKTGSLSINSENIFPIIKKWLYSDHDIFFRELISNGCDAITKLKKLDMMGEYNFPEGHKNKVEVILDPEKKTLKFIDTGLGMTAAEREQWLWHDAKLWLDSGAIFGDDGKDFERINVACPRATLVDGLESLKAAYDTLGL